MGTTTELAGMTGSYPDGVQVRGTGLPVAAPPAGAPVARSGRDRFAPHAPWLAQPAQATGAHPLAFRPTSTDVPVPSSVRASAPAP